jgi:predicted ribosomally synthesized peptide with nif11-like leader
MSKEAASAFILKARSDTQIQGKIVDLGPSANIEDVLDVAAASGYQFTEPELMAAGKEDAERAGYPAASELSESELELVAGGKFNLTFSRFYITTDTVSVVIKK